MKATDKGRSHHDALRQ